MKRFFEDFLSLFFPNICVACGVPLIAGEEQICISCLNKLPRTYISKYGNPTDRLFKNNINILQSSAFLYYDKGGVAQKLIHSLKYHNNKKTGYTLGRLAAIELRSHPDFILPDLLIPVPLHPKRQRKRGYNQSELIAKGMSSILDIPIDTTHLKRLKKTKTQTNKSISERNENVKQIFVLEREEELYEKHILLIDDVLTSGATITNCTQAFKQTSAQTSASQDKIKISVFAIAVARF